ncbi:MAG: calcium-binding protein [Rubrivivax sp.]|jgi:hypothetical protein
MTPNMPAASSTLASGKEQHRYTVTLEGGQRYRFELQGQGESTPGWLGLRVFDAAEPNLIIGALNTSGQTVGSVVFSPEHDQNLVLVVWQPSGATQAADYRLLVATIDPDDHGDTAATATTLLPGQALAGDLDRAGDIDSFALDLQAGERYIFTVAGEGADPLRDAFVVLVDADGQRLAASQGSLAFQSPVGGRHTLQIGPWTSDLGTYVVSAGLRPSDDHDDSFYRATAVAAGASASGKVEQVGDLDLFRVELLQGQVLEVEVNVVHGSDWPMLALFDAGGDPVAWGSFDPNQYRTGSRLTAERDGPIFVQVKGHLAGTDYRLDTRLKAGDDHSDTPDGATPLAPATVTTGQFDSSWDVDVFKLELRAGRTYRVEVDSDAQEAGGAVGGMGVLAADGHWLEASGYGIANGRGRLVLQAAADEQVTLMLRHNQPVHYRVQVAELLPDDHPDGPLGATLLTPSQRIQAMLDPGYEADVFRFEAIAGQAYRVSIDALNGDAWNAASLVIRGSGFQWLAGDPGQGQASLSVVFDARTSEAVTLTFAADTPQALAYALRIDALTSFELGVPELQDQGVLAIGKAAPFGVTLEGTAGSDRLDGSPLDDLLRGGAGNDVMNASAGNDWLSGGDGVDVARYDGRRDDYEISRLPNGDWRVTARHGSDGSDTLMDVERLQFADGAVALDVDGAGAGARVLRLMNAALGPDALFGWLPEFKPELFGVLLKNADRGLGDAELAERLLEQGPAWPGADTWVRKVAAHVPGLLNGESEIEFWVQRLERDEITAAEALALAASTSASRDAVTVMGVSDTAWDYVIYGP